MATQTNYMTASPILPDTSKEIDQISTALCQAQYDFSAAKKDSANPFFKSKYADLASVQAAAKESLHTNSLVYTQLPYNFQDMVGVKTILLHKSGQWIKSELLLPLDKKTPQAAGSVITYARRYSLAAILGIPQEDDDAESGMNRSSSKPKVAAPKPKKDPEAYEKLKAQMDKDKATKEYIDTNKKENVIDRISAEDGKKLLKAAEKNGYDRTDVNYFAGTLGYEKLRDLTQWDYETVFNYFNEMTKEERENHG